MSTPTHFVGPGGMYSSADMVHHADPISDSDVALWSRGLADHNPQLSAGQYAVLIRAIHDGTPVELVTTLGGNGRRFTAGENRPTETITTTVIDMTVTGDPMDRILTKYFGFNREIWLHRVLDVRAV